MAIMRGSLGGARNRLAEAGVQAKNSGGLESRVEEDFGSLLGLIDTANKHVTSALEKLYASNDAAGLAVDGIAASHKVMRKESGSVSRRVEGSLRDPLKKASASLLQEETSTKGELGEVRQEADEATLVIRGLGKAKEELDRMQALALNMRSGAEESSKELMATGENIISEANQL